MPFIVIYSVPASLLFGLVSAILLHTKGEDAAEGATGVSHADARVPLHAFVRYARVHLAVCAVLTTVLATGFFAWGQSMVYGDTDQYALVTLVFAAGPLVACFLSTVLLTRLIIWRGAKGTNLLFAAVAHILLLLTCIPLLMLVSTMTGARL